MAKITSYLFIFFLLVCCTPNEEIEPLSSLRKTENGAMTEYALVNSKMNNRSQLKVVIDEFIKKNGYGDKENQFESLRLIFIRKTKSSKLFMEKDSDYPTPDLEDVLCVVTWYNSPKFKDTVFYRF